jgi:superfamily II DNA or RNA helicase
MGFDQITLKSSYSSDHDDLLNDFYIPVLTNSIQYDRIAGFFTSSSLSYAARGIAGLIRNDGYMRLITSPYLKDEDIEVIKRFYSGDESLLNDLLIRDLDNLDDILENNHLQALYWLLANNRLEIKIALPSEIDKHIRSIFHMKIGIFRDADGRMISFSGSVNETMSGWANNLEEFKVFKADDLGQSDYFMADLSHFQNLWNDQANRYKVIPLPESVNQAILRRAPKNLDNILDQIDDSISQSKPSNKTPYEKLGLFDNQQKAVESWFSNNHQGIFEMATGTGKTRTAIGCMIKCVLHKDIDLVIISAPQNTILKQWQKNIEDIGLKGYQGLVCDSSNAGWNLQVIDKFLSLLISSDTFLVLYTTHRTLSSTTFIEMIKENKIKYKRMLICDEVHGIGAKESRKALIDDYDFRLGLSATPSRWFDEFGTLMIMEYFDKIVYEFSISEALTTINPSTNKPYLVHYYYYPIFITLTYDEITEYQDITRRLVKLIHNRQHQEKSVEYMEMLAYKRADIYKKANGKLDALQKLISEIEISNTIIYTSDKHLDQVLEILSEKQIRCHTFTQKEDTRPRPEYGGLSERDHIIKGFVDQDYLALVAIKCLDEGVDIPSADTAIIMTSNGNPREYIQRIGRVIRQNEKKYKAKIFDFIVKPSLDEFDPELKDIEKRIYEKELLRVEEIRKNAINSMEAYRKIYLQ